MNRRFLGLPAWRLIVSVSALVLMAGPVLAQAGGQIRGVVTDEKGEPVEGATVIIVKIDSSRRFEVKTNKRGEFLQIGLSSGPHRVSAEKDKIAAPPQDVQVRQGQPVVTNLVLGMMSAAASAEAAVKLEALKGVFDEGVAASNAQQWDVAISKFQEGITLDENCFDCYNNLGFVYIQQKQYDQAEAAYKKVTELAPDDAAAYNGLANIYNAQRKFDLAAEASAKAAQLAGTAAAAGGAGGAEVHFNQGVILWNAGKVVEAKEAFQAAIAADANHAESHYQLGMALVNEGDLKGAATEFQTYLKLAPEGQNAATAKSLLDQLTP